MKKMFALVITLALLAATVGSVFAAGPSGNGNASANGAVGGSGAGAGSGGNPRNAFTLAGTITAVDVAAQTVTVQVSAGSKVAHPFIGQTLTLQANPTTIFLLRNPDGTATPITINDLLPEQTVSASGVFAEGIWGVRRVTVGASLVHLP